MVVAISTPVEVEEQREHLKALHQNRNIAEVEKPKAIQRLMFKVERGEHAVL